MLMACFYARKTLREAALKGITHQLARSRGNISSIKYVKLVDKDTETEHFMVFYFPVTVRHIYKKKRKTNHV